MAALFATGVALAEDETEVIDASLDMEFLEYLGSWETSDDEWILFAGDEPPLAERTGPAQEGEDPAETNDDG